MMMLLTEDEWGTTHSSCRAAENRTVITFFSSPNCLLINQVNDGETNNRNALFQSDIR